MKNKILTTIVCIVLTISLSACSFGANKEKMTDKEKIEMGKKSSSINTTPQPQIFKATNVNEVGDTVQAIDVLNGKVVPNAINYTITKASMFSTFTEAGISQNKMLKPDPDFLDENGQLKSSVKFVVVELTVKNLKASKDMNIASFDFVYCDSSNISKETTAIRLPIPVYFSSSKNKSEKDYYAYDLAIGQSKNVKVGWYLDTAVHKASYVYLAFNLYQDEYRSFLNLGL